MQNPISSQTEQDIETAVVEALAQLGTPYTMVACDPRFADTAAFCERYGYPPENAGNTIIVASKKQPARYAACIVKATTRLDVNKTVRRLMDVSRVSFASAEETVQITGMQIGGVTPFRLPDDLPVYVDEQIMSLPYVILGSGGRSSKINISPQVFRHMPRAQVVAGLGLPTGP